MKMGYVCRAFPAFFIISLLLGGTAIAWAEASCENGVFDLILSDETKVCVEPADGNVDHNDWITGPASYNADALMGPIDAAGTRPPFYSTDNSVVMLPFATRAMRVTSYPSAIVSIITQTVRGTISLMPV